MTDVENGPTADDGGLEELAELNEAIKAGFRRASLHWMRAGYEVLAGLGAFLDEIATAGKDEDALDDLEETGPTRIQLD